MTLISNVNNYGTNSKHEAKELKIMFSDKYSIETFDKTYQIHHFE